MNKFLLSLVLTFAFSILVVLGVGFFQIISDILGNNLAVLGIGFLLLYLLIYATVSNMDNSFEDMSILENDEEEI